VIIYRHLIKVFILFFCYEILIAQETLPLTLDERDNSISTHLIYESNDSSEYLIYRGFIISYNYRYRIPNYTLHALTFNQIANGNSPARRRSNFFVDDNLLGNKSALNIDYKGSGYDRGHLVPAGDFYSNQLLKSETFVLSNIAPQNANLNRGIWRNLEERIRILVGYCHCDANVITGTIIKNNNVIGINNVGVPEMFYKIIYFEGLESVFAFLFDNNANYYQGELIDFQVFVDNIEEITGEDFFDRLPDQYEDILESSIYDLKKVLQNYEK